MADCSCPRIVDSRWQDREHDWNGKSFFSTPIGMFMHVPFRISSDIKAASERIREKGLSYSSPLMILSRDALFRGELLVGVDTPAEPDPDVLTFEDTTVFSRIYEGKWRDIASPTRRLVKDLALEGRKVDAVYYWYITCSICSGERGFRTVIFARLSG
jgi:hypothetical protein